MDLFNDIDFNDDNDILTSSILSNDVKEIAHRFAEEIDWMKVSYEIYDHYLIILDKDSYEDYNKGEQLTFDNVKLPFNPDCICLTFKFNNNYTRIEYIQVYPYMYSTNKTRISDDDFYAIKFANILYDEYNIITDKIIYGYDDITYNNVRDSFCVIYNRRRVKSNNDYTISDGFANNFPKLLNIKSECIANIVYVRQLSIQDETTCISLLNSLLKQFNKVMVNTCTTCIDNIPIYQLDKKNPKFFDILADNSEIRYDGDDYAIIDKNKINKLNKLNLMEKMNKGKCQQKYINENLFDDFDDILNDTDNNSEILGNQLLPVEKYLLDFFITHDNEDYQYEIYQTYLIIKSKLSKNIGEFKTPDNDIIPIAVDDIFCIIKFDNTHKNIDYIIFNKYDDDENDTVIIKLPLFTLQIDLYEQFKVKIKSIYISTNRWHKTLTYGNADIIARKAYRGFIENRNIPENAYENIPSKILKIGIPKFLTASGEYIDKIYVTTLRFSNITICFSFLNQLYIHTKDGMVVVDTMNGIKIKDKNFISHKKLIDDRILKELFYTDMRWFTLHRLFFERLKDKNILKENINQNHLYKSLVESIAISVKKSINEDKYDYGHHTPSSHLKQRIQRVLTNKFGYASLREVSRRIGNRDFYIANRTNVPNYPSKFEMAVVERSKKNEDNFRIPISRKGEMDILSDDNIKYVLFPRYIGTSNIDYIVYILDKDDIKEIYDNLKSILDRCKEEIKQGKRDRKTIKVNKSISDKWKNFLAPTAGADGVCLSNNCLKELAIDTFKLYNNMY